MLTYRDNAYYNFLNEREWQLPNKYFYNHDPVYGLTAKRADFWQENSVKKQVSDIIKKEHLQSCARNVDNIYTV